MLSKISCGVSEKVSCCLKEINFYLHRIGRVPLFDLTDIEDFESVLIDSLYGYRSYLQAIDLFINDLQQSYVFTESELEKASMDVAAFEKLLRANEEFLSIEYLQRKG